MLVQTNLEYIPEQAPYYHGLTNWQTISTTYQRGMRDTRVVSCTATGISLGTGTISRSFSVLVDRSDRCSLQGNK